MDRLHFRRPDNDPEVCPSTFHMEYGCGGGWGHANVEQSKAQTKQPPEPTKPNVNTSIEAGPLNRKVS
jgi:hypothetical protein